VLLRQNNFAKCPGLALFSQNDTVHIIMIWHEVIGTPQMPVDDQTAQEIQRRLNEFQSAVDFDVRQALGLTGVTIVSGNLISIAGGYSDRARRIYLDRDGFEPFAHELGHWLYHRARVYRHLQYRSLMDRAMASFTPVRAFASELPEITGSPQVLAQGRSRREAWARLFEQYISSALLDEEWLFRCVSGHTEPWRVDHYFGRLRSGRVSGLNRTWIPSCMMSVEK